MAVLKMCKINICATKEKRKNILELLQLKGCMEINEDVPSDSIFSKMNTVSQIALYEKNAALAENAIEIMEMYAPEKKSMLSSLEGRRSIELSEYNEVVKKQQRTMSKINELIGLGKVITEKENIIAKCEDEIKAIEPWLTLDIPMNYRGTKTTAFEVGIIPGSYTNETLISAIEKIEELPEAFYMQIVSSDKFQTYVTVTYLKTDEEQVMKTLREIGFSRPPVMAHHIPTQSVKNRENRIRESKLTIENTKAEIEEIAQIRDEIQKTSDYYRARGEKYQVLGEIAQSKHTFFIEGYIPEKEVSELKTRLEAEFDAVVDIEEPTNKDETPVLLSNNGFTGPVEGVVTSFGFPNKMEIDPTAITSIFYYIFFGMMLSDAAYGLIMAVACFVMVKKFPDMEGTFKKTLTMFMYCGVSTFIWGILFGGFFGDAITVITGTFFGKAITIPALWFAPIEKPMQMLIYCMAFGVIHLFTGLGIKGYMMLKHKDIMSFVCDVVFWYVFLIGLILLLLPTSIFASLAGTTIVFPAWLNLLAKVMAIGGMVGILLMAGRRSKNPVKRLLLGAYSLYDTTSWLSDLLSYSRLLALGLATGVIAQVINTMAAMGGRTVIGVILFIVVFLFGHTFNMAINLLGAYVHTNRLAFVEFFGKFYEGGGREFKPFKANTKYVKVKEN